MIMGMKNTYKFLSELLFTVLVAGVLSVLLGFVLWFVAANFDQSKEWRTYIDFVSGILFGLVVGYKLKALVLEHRKDGKKKK